MSTSTSIRGVSKNSTQRAVRPGGTIINVVTAIIFFGLLILAVSWAIKQWGQATEEYTGAMIGAKHDALSVKCQMNMRTIGQNIQMFSISNDGLPASLEELRQWSGGSGVFQCPAPDGSEYVYIPGQSGRFSDSNILVYEPNAVHDGRCGVLVLGGSVGLLSPEQLDTALDRTEAELRSPRR